MFGSSEDRESSAPSHLAKMIALLGPPPKDLLERGSTTSKFFDDDGKKFSLLLPA
jgi:serine/threonine-protein kinase SRPK3